MLGKSELIGIDVGQYSIKIARIKQTAKNISAFSMAYEVIPSEIRDKRDEETLAKTVQMVMKKQKISKGQVVFHVNLGDCSMRQIILENNNLTGNNLERAIEAEVNTITPLGLDNVYFDYDEKPDSAGRRTIVAVARDIANRKVNLTKGLPKTFTAPQVDVDAFAFSRLIEYVYKKEGSQGNTMIVDIGYSRSRFYVYDEEANLVFNREQQIGGKQVNDIIVDVFDINEETAENRKLIRDFTNNEYNELVLNSYVHTFSEQMNLVFDFYEASEYGKTPIQKVYLTGGGSNLAGLGEALSQATSKEIKLLDLSDYIRLSSSDRDNLILQTGLSHALAIGLAIEG